MVKQVTEALKTLQANSVEMKETVYRVEAQKRKKVTEK